MKPQQNTGGRDAYVIVPPLIKYSAGPLLGPALIEGTAMAAGFDVRTIDLNAQYLHSTGLLPPPNTGIAEYYGDHCKPGTILDQIAKTFRNSIDAAAPAKHVEPEPRTLLWLTHEEAASVAVNLGTTRVGAFLIEQIRTFEPPRVLGVSLMWEWQVIPALFISYISKKLWPSTKIVWGGSHVTALHDKIAADSRYGKFVDGFLPFHSEDSFVQLLEEPDDLTAVDGLIVAGQGLPSRLAHAVGSAKPSFPSLGLYGRPRLVLPIQLSVGCPYALCTFCTYPDTEPEYKEVELEQLDYLLGLAKARSAAISFKDSYVLHTRLPRIGERIRGEVPWSATTKLHPQLNDDLVGLIAKSGCKTLEVGLETLDPVSQLLIEKRQPAELLEQFLHACARHGVSAIVNYITSLPREEGKKSQSLLDQLNERLFRMRNEEGLIARTEPHRFRLERMSEMARHPENTGIKIVGEWPWSSVLKWEQSSKSGLDSQESNGMR